MSAFRFCVEFTVLDDVDLEERRNRSFSSEPLVNPAMTALRVALRSDGRWRLQHVSSITPEAHSDRWHLLVWVLVSGPSLDEARRVAQEGVHDVVNRVTTVTFYGITEEP